MASGSSPIWSPNLSLRTCAAARVQGRRRGAPRRRRVGGALPSLDVDLSASDDDGRMLSLYLDLYLDSRPIRGRLRTERGADEPFVGWLGFADALRRVHVFELGRDEPVTGP